MESPKRKEMWPVLLTPFTSGGAVDYDALSRLIDWYEENGASGLFAVCQSSEVFYLSLAERISIASFVKRRARIPVIASGHVSYAPDDQLDELRRVADTGVDALILITNRLCEQGAEPEIWMDRLQFLLSRLDPAMPLGFYECPYPYKRLVTLEELASCAKTGRFRFLKDTCCDLSLIRERLRVLEGSPLSLYNANTATLLASLQAGAAGFSGVMANFHPELYAWLLEHYRDQPEKARTLQAALTMCAQIERQLYPVNAKYHLQTLGLPLDTCTRARNPREMTPLFEDEVRQMAHLVEWLKQTLLA